jgi:hypothetical protein
MQLQDEIFGQNLWRVDVVVDADIFEFECVG